MKSATSHANVLRFLGIALASCCGVSFGCTTSRPYVEPQIPVTPPATLCTDELAGPCRTPREVEALLGARDLEILSATGTPGGAQGAYLLTVRSRGTILRAKWRVEGEASSIVAALSKPRREATAYRLQELFLNEGKYVVPPTVGYCLPLESYRKVVDSTAESSHADVPCVKGFLSYWLNDVETIEASDSAATNGRATKGLFSRARYSQDREYASELARLNVFAFILQHGDAHAAQFVLSDDPFEVWSIDHSISLTAIKNPMVWFEEDWSRLRVPSIPRQLAARILALGWSDVERLAVIGAYRQLTDRWIPAAPNSENAVGHWGATSAERRLIWQKIRKLQRRLEHGQLDVF